jgi:hypothetical protein
VGLVPGRKGEIVYGWLGVSAYRAGPTHTSIRAVDPRSGSVRVLRDCPLMAEPWPAHTDCTVSAPRYLCPPAGRTSIQTREAAVRDGMATESVLRQESIGWRH